MACIDLSSSMVCTCTLDKIPLAVCDVHDLPVCACQSVYNIGTCIRHAAGWILLGLSIFCFCRTYLLSGSSWHTRYRFAVLNLGHAFDVIAVLIYPVLFHAHCAGIILKIHFCFAIQKTSIPSFFLWPSVMPYSFAHDLPLICYPCT